MARALALRPGKSTSRTQKKEKRKEVCVKAPPAVNELLKSAGKRGCQSIPATDLQHGAGCHWQHFLSVIYY